MIDQRVKSFLKLCEELNFTKAAAALHITQPAISKQIQDLESHYATRLFERDGRKVSLTKAGELVKLSFESMRNNEAKLLGALELSRHDKKLLNFGVTMSIGEYVIIAPLARYIKDHPETDICLRYGNTATLLRKLHEGSIDFAIVEGYFNTEQYETLPFSNEAFICCCHCDHQLTKRTAVLADLFPERLLLREPGSGTRAILERSLAVQGLSVKHFRHFVELANMHAIVSLLKADCGISFLYESVVREELAEGSLRRIVLEDFQQSHNFTFLWDKGSAFTEEYRDIFKALTADRAVERS